MEKAVAYCTASQGLSALSRDERSSISDAVASRNYHLAALGEELEKHGWGPCSLTVNGEPVYVVARTRKVMKPFLLEDILVEVSSLGSLVVDGERSITDAITEHILRKYTEHVPCGARVTRKVPDAVRERCRALSNRTALEKVLELDERIAALKAPFKAMRKPHQKTKRLLESEVMENLGRQEATVDTPGGAFVLKCRTHTRPATFSAREIAAAVKEAAGSFVEGHSLDDRASTSTVDAVKCDEFADLLKTHLVQTAESAQEPQSQTKLQCVRE